MAVCALAPGAATAATVVNGDFEAGNLSGWHVQRVTALGDWFAYEGTEPPIGGKELTAPIPEPPQGRYAAVTDEINPDTVILYQDVALRPEYDHRLGLWAYYVSDDPIAVPSPDTLSVADETLAGQANQQYRIDVVRPGAPIDSVDPADILLTVFRTRPGAPKKLSPRWLSADLSPFAGQTVRLRMAVAAHEETLNAGLDGVAIESAPDGKLPPRKGPSKPGADRLGFGKVQLNRRNGSAILPVRVPGPGKLSAKGEGPAPGAGKAKKRKLIEPVSARVAKVGTVKLRLRPTAVAGDVLELKRKLRVRVAVTFRPSADKPETATVPVVLRLAASKPR